ncbi:hypothetical protein N9K16_05945, partial [Alphaproteobacteria bacterium]|nr:hypothetical protein [Alphaproteobacteria bacterium]
VGFFLLIVSIALIDLIRRFIGHRMAALEKKMVDGSTITNSFGSRRFYNLVTRFVVAVILSGSLMAFFRCGFALPFFGFGLVCAFLFNSALLRLAHIRGVGFGYIRMQTLDLVTLCAYVLSLCGYFYLYGAHDVDLVGFFVIILVPRVSFTLAGRMLTAS